MRANELKRLYIEYFTEKGHAELPSASLLPENDPSVLFTTAGMHPLIPYLLGEKHPKGGRLVNVQKCVRTGDIDEVGDKTHLTFFEMLGNWSLGDYFKGEAIARSYEFLTERLGIPKNRLAVTVFCGEGDIPRDNEAYELWRERGLTNSQIFFYGREENWWGPAGLTGPCGPDTEIFYDTGSPPCGVSCGPACRCGKYIEIWNNVFMEYNKNADGSYSPLPQKNVDTGMGLERVLAIINNVDTVYKTELFLPLIEGLEELSGVRQTDANERQYRIICEHTRALTFILGDPKKITPSNSEQGYILRRLIRRAIRHSRTLFGRNVLSELATGVIFHYQEEHPELGLNQEFILAEIKKESLLFERTLEIGMKTAERHFSEIRKGGLLDGRAAFRLYDTYGFPIELTEELAAERGIKVDTEGYFERFRKHQENSRLGAERKFKGGMADHSEKTTLLHTATHLLHGALSRVLGDAVCQRGSNITPERLRFDFSFDRKLTQDELSEVSAIVNEAIKKDLPVVCEEMSIDDAKRSGAVGLFGDKYGDIVKVYTTGGYSKEICGGPHAGRTGELGSFRIIKEESCSAGVRRIRAIIV